METIRNLYYNPSMWIILPIRFIKRFRKKVGVVATFTVLFLYSVNFFIISNAMTSERPMEPGELPFVVVHLDLKGAPPTLQYLKSILPKLQELGTNGLLIEYEDMFPYTDWLQNLSTPYHYPAKELKNFLKHAHNSGFEVIPLVQTFGHMEHVLKLDDFARFRENPLYPDSLCPSNEAGFDVVREMLRQVINFHKEIAPLEHIHVGCDEVYHMNNVNCPLCRKRKLDNQRIYLTHIKKVSEAVRLLSPTTNVLIWDDMLRSIKPQFWDRVRYFNNVEPVWWNYVSGVTINHSILRYYHKKFNNIWIASAFKGADARDAGLPNMTERFLNHLSWINIIRDYRFGGENQNFRFKGFILTGWSRYSHFDPLCELLPMSLPSLFLNLILIKKFPTAFTIKRTEYSNNQVDNFYNYLKNDFYDVLKCDRIDRSSMDDFNKCYNIKIFGIYNSVKKYLDYIDHIHKTIGNRDMTLIKQFDYLNLNYINTETKMCKMLYESLKVIEADAKGKMRLAFDENVYKEYIGYKSYKVKKMLKKCSENEALEFRTWPRGRKIKAILEN